MKILSAIGWRLGLSYRGVAGLYGAFRVKISRMKAWRDVQLRADQLRKGWSGKTTRVVGIDRAYVLGPRGTEPVQAAKDLNLEHQVCQFHVRRWVGKALHELKQTLPEEWLWMLDEVRQILGDLLIKGDKRLLTLYRQLPAMQNHQDGSELSPVEKLRNLILRLSNHWSHYRVFQWQENVPWTNNPSEQGIGRMKMRARTVRGYKNWLGMFSGLMVAGSSIS